MFLKALLFLRGLGTQKRPERTRRVKPILRGKEGATHSAMWFIFTFVSTLDANIRKGQWEPKSYQCNFCIYAILKLDAEKGAKAHLKIENTKSLI